MEVKSYNVTVSTYCEDGRVNTISRTYPVDCVAHILHNALRDVEDIAETMTLVSLHCHYDEGMAEVILIRSVKYNEQTGRYEFRE